MVLGLGSPQGCASSHPSVGDGSHNLTPGKMAFIQRFVADSEEAGLARTLMEERQRAERLFAEEKWDEALQVFEEMAKSAVELPDRASEAVAVLGMANCLSKPERIDVEMICGMYRYAGDAAQEVGDPNVRFLALCGCAQVRRSCRMLQKSETLWTAALDLATSTGNLQHTALAKSQLAMTLLQDPSESNLDIVDESKGSVDHASVPGHGDTLPLRGGSSLGFGRALKLLAEVVGELPESASTMEKVNARMNLASALRQQKGVKGKRKAEQEMVFSLDLLTANGGEPSLLYLVESSLLELYEEHTWLADESTDAADRIARLRTKMEAKRKTIEQVVADKGKPSDPEERHAYEMTKWAAQKLEAMKIADIKAAESDSDIDAEVQARPSIDGWQR